MKLRVPAAPNYFKLFIPPVLGNRYLVATLISLVWLVFFDKNKLLIQWKLSETEQKLNRDIKFYTERIDVAKVAKADLEQNQEKFAREKYFMQKADEEVFIIVDKIKP
ncbi:MAG: hypothetical protein ABIV51_13580 [Saprospiraceae bacterium]